MSESENNELQLTQIRRTLNNLLKLEPTWTPKVGEQLEAFLFDTWVIATVLSCPNDDSDLKKQISGWKIRLDSGQETYVWKEEYLRSFEF